MPRATIALALAWVALVTATIALPAVALGSPSRATTNSKTYADARGEDPAGPDITSIAVSNDDTGLIDFKIAIANRPALTPDMLVLLFLDTDRSTKTGDNQAGGADYVIQLAPDGVALFKWNGSDYVTPPSEESLASSYAPTGPTLRIRASEIGGTKSLDFRLVALSGLVYGTDGAVDTKNAHRDFAPDVGKGSFSYDVRTTLSLGFVDMVGSPQPARAGKPFSVGLAANESDTSGPVEQGRVTCTAHVGATSLRATANRLVNGIGVCAWSIPKTARGKAIRGRITITKAGAQIARPFSTPIS
jgi:hypothetical protein